MKILVANLGSTSFKYRLFDMDSGGSLPVAASSGSARRRAAARCEIGVARRGADAPRPRPRRGGAPVPGAIDRSASRAASATRPRCRPSASRRCTAAASSGVQRVTARRARRDGGGAARGPGPQPALHQRHAAVGGKAAGDPPGGGLRNRLPRDDSRPQPLLRRALRVGGRRAWCAAGASTAPAIATSPTRTAELLGRGDCGSSPATWAAPARSARSATARAWPPAWA